jgi:hypothetical protein
MCVFRLPRGDCTFLRCKLTLGQRCISVDMLSRIGPILCPESFLRRKPNP